MERPGSPDCTEGQEREARGNAASPQLKTEGRVLLCFWLRNRRGISPATSPYVGPTSMEGNRLQNHRGNKSAMRTATLLKMPEGSSFGQEATPEVMGSRADLLITMPRPYGAVSWGLQQPVMNPSKRLHVSITALERSASRVLLTQVILVLRKALSLRSLLLLQDYSKINTLDWFKCVTFSASVDKNFNVLCSGQLQFPSHYLAFPKTPVEYWSRNYSG